MKQVMLLSLILIIVIIAASFVVSHSIISSNVEAAPFYVGVTFCGNTTAEAKLLIDKVKDYTNLFVLQSWSISNNETATTEICDYAVASGLNIIVNLGVNWTYTRVWTWQFPWFESAKQRYGDRFIGSYYDDEPAGIQLDYNWFNFFLNYSSYFEGTPHVLPLSPLHQIFADLEDKMANVTRPVPKDYDTEAEWFQMILENNQGRNSLKDAGIKTFTSDYLLYWFDYLGGYDVMLAQFGWNNSYIQDIALVRGAARMQNKSWGAIVTWKYDEPPYLDSGEEIYNQMHAAYEAGAEYIIVFNYPQIEGNPYGTLTDEHFEALEKLWNEVTRNPRDIDDVGQAEAALVLPRNYGWGMRHPEDRIWGFWGPDEKSPKIWENSRKLLSQYGTRLDIVYDDPAFPVAGKYPVIYYWNQTL